MTDGIDWLFQEQVDRDLSGYFSRDRSEVTRLGPIDAGLPAELFAHNSEAHGQPRSSEPENALLTSLRRVPKRSSTFAGDLAAVPFTDVVVMLEASRRSGILSICGNTALAQLFFDRGSVVHAVFGELSGHAAFYALIAEQAGQFEFLPEPCTLIPKNRTITEPITVLLMEGSRIFDEANDKEGPDAWSKRMPKERCPRPTHRPPPALGQEVLNSDQLAELSSWIEQASTIGHVRRWTSEQFTDTLEDHSRSGLLFVVLCELAEVARELFAMAESGSLAEIFGEAQPEQGFLGIGFSQRAGPSLDVVLVDLRSVRALASILGRAPAAVILLPPHGTLSDLGAGARVDLELLLGRMRPPVIIGMGSLEGILSDLFRGSLNDPLISCIASDASRGLRTALREGVRLCAQVLRSLHKSK